VAADILSGSSLMAEALILKVKKNEEVTNNCIHQEQEVVVDERTDTEEAEHEVQIVQSIL
jgi:hypothetical protein